MLTYHSLRNTSNKKRAVLHQHDGPLLLVVVTHGHLPVDSVISTVVGIPVSGPRHVIREAVFDR
jgi:hypothetical protein